MIARCPFWLYPPTRTLHRTTECVPADQAAQLVYVQPGVDVTATFGRFSICRKCAPRRASAPVPRGRAWR